MKHDTCVVVSHGIYRKRLLGRKEPVKDFWCTTHGCWFYEWPVKVTWHWADGTETVVEDKERKVERNGT
jgi:hypothetical protein